MRYGRTWGLILLILITTVPLSAADITVPELELITRAYVENESLVLDTLGDIEIDIEGGYKLGGSLSLGIESNQLGAPREELDTATATAPEVAAYLNEAPYLFLQGAEVVVREAFNRPINISYFIGENDTFANGDIFPDYYGSSQVASRLRGYLYFPTGVVYDGLYTVNGTGLKLETDFGRPWNQLGIYTYQDNYLGRGEFSSDIRWSVDKESFKLETFAGGSYPFGDYGLYRGGILIGLFAEERGEFFAQVGIPRLAPGEDDLDIGLFYFLFEPRINFGIGSLIFTYFSHPSYYKALITEVTGEEGDMHTNINLQFGKPEETPMAGGLEGTIIYSDDSDFDGIVSPYISFITEGAVWNLKFNWNATETSDPAKMFDAFIGVRAEF